MSKKKRDNFKIYYRYANHKERREAFKNKTKVVMDEETKGSQD